MVTEQTQVSLSGIDKMDSDSDLVPPTKLLPLTTLPPPPMMKATGIDLGTAEFWDRVDPALLMLR